MVSFLRISQIYGRYPAFQKGAAISDEDPAQRRERLNALLRYDVLDTPKESDFDEIVTLAAEICGTPISLISLIDEHRQWFKAEHGLGLRETPLDQSMCRELLHESGVSIVPDASRDARFADHNAVTGDFGVRFYAGAPLVTPEGTPIGMLCVLDRQPRELTPQQGKMLQALARQAMSQMEMRRALREQERTAEALTAARKNLDLIVESARDFAIIATGRDGRIQTWNTGATILFGYVADEMIGQHIGRIFTPEDREHDIPKRELDTAAANGKAADERWHMRKDGSAFFANGIVQSMLGPDGEVLGFIKLCRDMTARKEMEDALIAARNYAESASLAKTEFLANMSHEIRTPMNAIMGLAHILGMTQLDARQRQFVNTLKTSSDALLVLINDLLDIAKIEANTLELEQVPFSLSDIVNDVISMMSVRTAEKGIAFTMDDEAVAGQRFVGDPARLRQVIVNLCSNAIKFTDQGGIHVMIASTPAGDGLMDTVSIAVRDTGIGIDPAKQELIFDKFVQADSSINRKYGGTGLGLTISKTIAQAMGGTITVESKPGEGSCFTVLVPLLLAEPEAASPRVLVPNPPVRGENGRILLVEDYAPNVIVAGTFLEDFGYSFDVAQNGAEAVAKARAGQYHAILMDVQMHGMNGLEATHLIRGHERQTNRARVPIIGMTAHALSGDRERCLAAGMDDYISKPFNPDDLQAKLGGVSRNAA